MEKITVVIVDGQSLVREMYCQIFANHEKLEIVGLASSLSRAVEMIAQKTPNIVLMDDNLPPFFGLDLFPLISQFSPDTRVIAVSTNCRREYVKKFFRAGGKGYLNKNTSIEKIMIAIEAVMTGQDYLSPDVRSELNQELFGAPEDSSELRRLTAREQEIVRYIRDGFSLKEIASISGITARTVAVHRGNINRKLSTETPPSPMNP